MRSAALALLAVLQVQTPPPPIIPPVISTPAGSAAIEQRSPGTAPPPVLVDSFDGLGVGFEGPQGTAFLRNPSDNSLAVGPDHIVQTVNSRMAIFTKKGDEVRHDRQGALRPGRHAATCSRASADRASAQQRRRRRALRPARRPLADRHADLPPAAVQARSSRAGQVGRAGVLEPPGRPAASPAPAVPLFQPPPPPPTAAASGAPDSRVSAAACRQAEPGLVRDVLRGQHRPRSARARTTATCSSGRCFPTIRGRRSGPTATTCRPAPATT